MVIKLKDFEIEYQVIAPPKTKKSVKKSFVFINGFYDPFQNHLDILRAIASKGYKVYAVNTPGHGKSLYTGQTLSWENLADIVKEFIDAKRIKDPILAGYSMGGGIALKTAEKYPKTFKSLSLLAPLCFPINNYFPKMNRYVHFLYDLFVIDKLRRNHNKKNPTIRVKKRAALKYLRMFRRYDLDYQKLEKVPIKIVGLEKDEIIDCEKLEEILPNLPKAKFVKVKDVFHDIYFIEKNRIEEIGKEMS